MSALNFQRSTVISPELVNLGTNEEALYISGQKTTTGAPVTTAGYFAPSCMIQNVATGLIYVNVGTTASPVWEVITTS